MKNQVISTKENLTLKQEIQTQIQASQARMLEKANSLVDNKKVKRSQCTGGNKRNVWLVGSYSTIHKWYIVRWNEDLDGFTCGCKAFEFSCNGICLHIAACAIFEGKGSE